MQVKTWKDFVFMVLLSFALIMMITGLFGACNPAKKAQRELEKAKSVLHGNIAEAAKFCAEKFPPQVQYIKGDSVIVLDTLYVGGDVIFDTVETKDTVFITKTLPAKVITKTIRQVDTVRDSNPAALIAANVRLNEEITKVARLTGEKQLLAENNKELKKERNNWRLYFFILLILSLGWTFRKTLIKLIKPI